MIKKLYLLMGHYTMTKGLRCSACCVWRCCWQNPNEKPLRSRTGGIPHKMKSSLAWCLNFTKSHLCQIKKNPGRRGGQTRTSMTVSFDAKVAGSTGNTVWNLMEQRREFKTFHVKYQGRTARSVYVRSLPNHFKLRVNGWMVGWKKEEKGSPVQWS